MAWLSSPRPPSSVTSLAPSAGPGSRSRSCCSQTPTRTSTSRRPATSGPSPTRRWSWSTALAWTTGSDQAVANAGGAATRVVTTASGHRPAARRRPARLARPWQRDQMVRRRRDGPRRRRPGRRGRPTTRTPSATSGRSRAGRRARGADRRGPRRAAQDRDRPRRVRVLRRRYGITSSEPLPSLSTAAEPSAKRGRRARRDDPQGGRPRRLLGGLDRSTVERALADEAGVTLGAPLYGDALGPAGHPRRHLPGHDADRHGRDHRRNRRRVSDAAVEVTHLSVAFGGKRALDDVTFAAPAGCIVGVIGPNGAGKSTLFRAMLGLLPHSGRSTSRAPRLCATGRRHVRRLPGDGPGRRVDGSLLGHAVVATAWARSADRRRAGAGRGRHERTPQLHVR